MPIPEKDWNWIGYPGHYICADRCRYRLCTDVGNYRISTVGAMYPTTEFTNGQPPKMQEVGSGRYYETYVFRLGDERCAEPSCGCDERVPSSWSEIDGVGSNTVKEAREAHYRFCRKYAAMEDTDARP